MATFKILMLGGRRCGKTTILSKIKKDFNNVLHHAAGTGNDLLTLLPPVGEITSLNKAEECILNLFKEHEEYDDFPIDENRTYEKSTISFELSPYRGNGSLTFEFTDIPGEWCSNPPQQGGAPNNHMEEVKQLMIDSNVIIIAIDTPSLMEENGEYADYYNRINDIKELFRNAFAGETFNNPNSQKMVLFIPMKCEKYIINNDGTTNINNQKGVSDKVEQKYKDIIDFFGNYRNNITMAILPIVTIKEVEWRGFFALDGDGNKIDIYQQNGRPKYFRYSNSDQAVETLYSKFGFKSNLFYDIANDISESQSLYCEQPLVYSLVYLFQYYTEKAGELPEWVKKIPIFVPIANFFKSILDLFGIFKVNDAYKKESIRLKRDIMKRGNGFEILQNPLGI